MAHPNEQEIMDNSDVQANASGIDQPVNVVRKGRVRKACAKPRTTPSVKKKKEPKPPRNPFRRSETGKLQLKRLQMMKRVESMTPRVQTLRDRLALMSGRLDFVAGKLKLVIDELTSRTHFLQTVGVVDGENKLALDDDVV
jgi:hypothetical protein